MLVVNLKQFEDEAVVAVALQDVIDDIQKDLDEVTCEEDKESNTRTRNNLVRIQNEFKTPMLHRSTELVEKCLGYFWDLLNTDDYTEQEEYLEDQLGLNTADIREIFHYLGYEEEEE